MKAARISGLVVASTLALAARDASANDTSRPANKPASVEVAHGRGATLRAAGDVAELNIRARVQVQGALETNAPDEDGVRAPPDTAFFVRRFRLVFQGHVLARALRYYFQLGLATADMESDLLVPLRDAYLEWQTLRDLRIRAGQGKVPHSRERQVSSSALELVDRSNVNAELSLDRDVGVTLFSRDLLGAGERLTYSAGVYGGDGRNRRGDRAGLLWVARFESLPLGGFDDYVEGDLDRHKRPKVAIGTSFAYNDDTARAQSTLGSTFTTGTVDYRHASADVFAKWRGASLLAEVIYRKADTLEVGRKTCDDGEFVVERPRSALGYVLQAGFLVTHKIDVAARYGEVRPLDDSVVRRDREIGGGIGWFPKNHDLKLQLDYFRLLRDRDDGDVALDRVRIQTQLFF